MQARSSIPGSTCRGYSRTIPTRLRATHAPARFAPRSSRGAAPVRHDRRLHRRKLQHAFGHHRTRAFPRQLPAIPPVCGRGSRQAIRALQNLLEQLGPCCCLNRTVEGPERGHTPFYSVTSPPVFRSAHRADTPNDGRSGFKNREPYARPFDGRSGLGGHRQGKRSFGFNPKSNRLVHLRPHEERHVLQRQQNPVLHRLRHRFHQGPLPHIAFSRRGSAERSTEKQSQGCRNAVRRDTARRGNADPSSLTTAGVRSQSCPDPAHCPPHANAKATALCAGAGLGRLHAQSRASHGRNVPLMLRNRRQNGATHRADRNTHSPRTQQQAAKQPGSIRESPPARAETAPGNNEPGSSYSFMAP